MFSLILPAYNEENRLENCVSTCLEYLGKGDEIIIAEDGSSDRTREIGERLAKKFRNVKFIHFDEKLGRGMALKNAFSFANGDRLGYIDVDMATDMNYLPKLIKYSNKYDLVTGSRYMKASVSNRPVLRDIVSRSYNFLIRFLIGVKVYDSQCGFKSFSRKFVNEIVNNISEKSWAWDTVVIVECVKNNYSFKEFPVRWSEAKDASHSSSLKRISSDILIHGSVILKLFAKWRFGFSD